MAKIAGFFVTKNTVFQMTIDISFSIFILIRTSQTTNWYFSYCWLLLYS